MPAPKPSAPPTASKLDTSKGNATSALYSAAIGPISIDYYLPLFTQFEEAGRPRLAWNWAACLYTVNWMIFRGLGLAALAYGAIVAGAALLLLGVGHLIFQLSPTTELALVTTLMVLAFGVPGLLGNWFLYTVYRKKMAHALRESSTFPEACTLLAREASSRRRFLWLVSLNVLTVTVALSLYAWGVMRSVQPASAPTTLPVQPGAAAGPLNQPTDAARLSTPEAPSSPVQSGRVENAEISGPTPVSGPTPSPTQAASIAQPARPRFYINVGLFAKEANAQNALNRLEKVGLPTLSGTVNTSRGVRTRVRAGPFNSEQDAQAAAATIRALNLDAVVMPPT